VYLALGDLWADAHTRTHTQTHSRTRTHTHEEFEEHMDGERDKLGAKIIDGMKVCVVNLCTRMRMFVVSLNVYEVI